jgi:hypothetical protein
MPRRLPSRSGCGRECDPITLAVQRLNGPVADPLGMSAVVVVGAAFLTRQQMVRGHEDGVAMATTAFWCPRVPDPTIACREGSGGGSDGRGRGRFDQRGAEPAFATGSSVNSLRPPTVHD